MNWVKLANLSASSNTAFVNNGATKDFDAAIAKSQPVKAVKGDATGGLGEQGAAKPLQPQAPVQTPPTSQPAPPNPMTPTHAQTPAQQTSDNVMGMFLPQLQQLGQHFSTPQGFGQLASAAPGLTQGVLRLGGMPALMAIFGQLKQLGGGEGADDWQTLMQPGYKSAAAPWASPPAPAATPGGGAAPWLNGPRIAPAGGGGRFAGLPAMPQDPAPEPPKPAAAGDADAGPPVDFWHNPLARLAMDYPRYGLEFKAVQRAAPLLKNLGVEGTELAAKAAPQVAKAAPQAAKAAPSLAARAGTWLGEGAREGALWATPVNMLEEGLDAAGVLPQWAGGKPDSLWWKADRDQAGNVVRDERGDPAGGHYGLNWGGLGWDPKDYDYRTTPSSDTWGNNVGARFQAAGNPLHGLLYAMPKFTWYDMNPLRDTAAMGGDYNWSTGRGTTGSIPAAYAQNLALDSSSPLRPGQAGPEAGPADAERAAWQKNVDVYRSQNRFHRDYNPAGTRPGGSEGAGELPSVGGIFRDPINQGRNWGHMARARGLLPTARTALFGG